MSKTGDNRIIEAEKKNEELDAEYQEKQKQVEWAKDFLSFYIKEGQIDDVEDLPDDEIIELAAQIQNRGDLLYDQWKEDHE